MSGNGVESIEAYYGAVHEPYEEVCGKSEQGTVVDENFLKAYSKYVDSMKDMSLWRHLSFVLSLDGIGWVRKDFRKFLEGGRRCAEGTPGYEKFMPQTHDPNLRSIARAMLSTHLFNFDQKVTGEPHVSFDASILGLNLGTRRAHRVISRTAGFHQTLTPDEQIGGIFKNAQGDRLVTASSYIFWEPQDTEASFGATFTMGADGRIAAGRTAFIIRRGDKTKHPFLERHEGIVNFIDGFGDEDPQLQRLMEVFGYRYSGDMDAEVAANYFKGVATTYDTMSIRYADIGHLKYNAAVQYYLAAAASLAAGDILSARSMFAEMGRCLTIVGVEHHKEFFAVDKALEKLSSRTTNRQGGSGETGGPSISGLFNGGGPVGPFSPQAQNGPPAPQNAAMAVGNNPSILSASIFGLQIPRLPVLTMAR